MSAPSATPPAALDPGRGRREGDGDDSATGALAALRRRVDAAPDWSLLVAAALVLVLALALLGDLFVGEPSGPPSSSYATNARGLAAWAELLGRSGHPVSQLRTALARARLASTDTVVVIDPEALLPQDGARLRAFVRAGGQLVIGGSEAQSSLPALIAQPPPWSEAGSVRQLARAGAGASVAGVREVRSAGEGEWTAPGEGFSAPLRGRGTGGILLERRLGAGSVKLLADASPLQNRLLASADNAQLALDLAGGRTRPVVFVESVHGFGEARGFAAVPARWRLAFALLALAGVLWVLARGRRLGPAEQERARTPPPRAAYVEAMALLLRRTGSPRERSAALTRLRDRG